MGRIVTRIAAYMLGLALIGALAGVGREFANVGLNVRSTENALASIREVPLVGLVLQDYPEAEARVRDAVERDRRAPHRSGPSEVVLTVRELSRQYIVPMLRRASDESIMDVARTRAELAGHLQESGPSECRSFILTSIERVELLPAEARRLFDQALQVMQAAYRSGRSGSRQTDAVIDDERAGAILVEAGFEDADFDRLEKLYTLSAPEVCELGTRLLRAPSLVPRKQGADLARYLAAR